MRAPFVAFVVMVVSAASCATAEDPEAVAVPGADVPVEVVAAQFGGAVWRVETDGCGWTGVGSAFAVDDRWLVTNHHVIANDTAPTVRSRDGEIRAGRVIGTDPARDVAVIEVEEPLAEALSWAPTSGLQRQERLVVLGYPRPAHDFTTAYGSIVDFAASTLHGDVLLADVPIDRGNSGGPALRGDGSVVGVVTRVVLDDPDEHMAIVYPADRILSAVEAAIEQPRAVSSDCGLGPDYVPPLPDGVDVAAPPPPPSPEVTATEPEGDERAAPEAPMGTTSPRSPRPTVPDRMTPTTPATPPTQAPCPSGRVDVAVIERSATPDGDGQMQIEVRGTVTNQASQTVTVSSVRVTHESEEPTVVEVAPAQPELAPTGTTSWESTALVPVTGDAPPTVRVAVDWQWADAAATHCPRPPAAS